MAAKQPKRPLGGGAGDGVLTVTYLKGLFLHYQRNSKFIGVLLDMSNACSFFELHVYRTLGRCGSCCLLYEITQDQAIVLMPACVISTAVGTHGNPLDAPLYMYMYVYM